MDARAPAAGIGSVLTERISHGETRPCILPWRFRETTPLPRCVGVEPCPLARALIHNQEAASWRSRLSVTIILCWGRGGIEYLEQTNGVRSRRPMSHAR